jgi:hypothetical protein
LFSRKKREREKERRKKERRHVEKEERKEILGEGRKKKRESTQ